ncbi:calcium-binding protein [Nocardioides immobilis]|uniref:calcium-binding protein n=1 Tax=Nocardioides immobilis TaxID=2049295 RepID=UPI0015FCD437|nr:calcium-binding protein [Nocardioides immobilis]
MSKKSRSRLDESVAARRAVEGSAEWSRSAPRGGVPASGILRAALGILATATLAAVAFEPAPVAAGGTPPNGPGTAGPPYNYTTELMVPGPAEPLVDKASLDSTKHGYRFRAGQQDTHLTITVTPRGRLKLVDTGTKSFKDIARVCKRRHPPTGIAAVCPIPAGISADKPLLIEVWPRLGDDYVDTSSLPETYAVTVLGDAGKEVVKFGAGWDFFNGHTGRDVIEGGDGNDWIRSGGDNDLVHGDGGDDQIIDQDAGGNDVFFGGSGDDRLGGNSGIDRLVGGDGNDFVLCGDGIDAVISDGNDRINRECEVVAFL